MDDETPGQELSAAAKARWLAIALAEEQAQVREGHAPGTERILAYLATCGDLEDGEGERDDTPWCSAFLNWCVMQAGFAGTDSGWATSWARWGREDPQPGPGTIVVWRRSRDLGNGLEPVGGHVAFLLERRGDMVHVLGGNQRDAVCRRDYPLHGFLADTVDRAGEVSDHYELLGFRTAP
ncbi:TIGR02594 family protein [Sphingomonas parva]|nr:TIGR02594 family protein [Sphingomonas parva]